MEQGKEIYRTEYRNVTIKTADGSTLVGKINIGLKARVADLFTKSTVPFIVLSDVDQGDGSKNVFIINKNNIVWVKPEEGQ